MGSVRVDFTWIKSRPSWFKEREVVADNNKRHRKKRSGGGDDGVGGGGGGGMVGMEVGCGKKSMKSGVWVYSMKEPLK